MNVRVALFNSMHGNKVKVFMRYNVMSIYCLLNLRDKEEEMCFFFYTYKESRKLAELYQLVEAPLHLCGNCMRNIRVKKASGMYRAGK